VKPVSLLAGAAVLIGLAVGAGMASAGGQGCSSGTNGSAGYAYAGHQSTVAGHGIRARITLLGQPRVSAGHVAAWVGVGGPDAGPNGEDQWLQVGIAAAPQLAPLLYTEITRPGRTPVFVPLESDLAVGETRTVAVLEVAQHPGWWRVWVNGEPKTRAIRLPGSSGHWRPIATAESFNGGRQVCNGFAFRFDRVGVASWRGGSWHPFVPGYRFQDRGFRLRTLAPLRSTGVRALSAATAAPQPYAFEASAP
jgi:hypothetical protein